MKVGDLEHCSDCGVDGVVVTTNVAGTDLDRELQRMVSSPLEPSAYEPGGLTCRLCETTRFKSVLPERGVCAACGKHNARATAADLGATRSFCDTACINAFINARLGII